MRSSLMTMICVLFLLGGGTGATMATDQETMLIDCRNDTQALISGNPQANGRIAAIPSVRGKLLWSRYYSEIDSLLQPKPSRVLMHGGVIGVILQEDLLLYDRDGHALRQELLSDGELAAFGDDSYCWITPARQLSCRRYDGSLVIEGHSVPLFDDRSKLRMIYPLGNEFVAVTQYSSGLPVRSTPTSAFAYHMTFGKSAWDWIVEISGVISPALITTDNERLVLVGSDSFHVYAMKDGSELGSFPTTLCAVKVAMISVDNELVVFGDELDGQLARPIVRSISLEGNPNWEFKLMQPLFSHQPACGRQNEIYFLDSGFLFCLIDGKEIWRVPHVYTGRSWLSATDNGDIIATDSTSITIFSSSGKVVRQLKCPQGDDSFATPVAITGDGRIVVSGQHALYCFD